MQTAIYNGNAITHNGRDYKITFEPDYDTGAPWEEYDGAGIIRERRARYNGDGYDKSPADIGYVWAYDWLRANGYPDAEYGTLYLREVLGGTYDVCDVQRKKDL